MSTREIGRGLSATVSEHAERHGSTYAIFARVVVYSLGLLGCMWVAAHFLGDTYLANLGLFMLFATTAELLWAGVVQPARFLWYVLVVLLMAAAGLLLQAEAKKCAGAGCGPETHHKAGGPG